MPSTTTRHLTVPPAAVWNVLSDGWLYGLWVVGASRIREVDDQWPAKGTAIHHSIGSWPLLIDDCTTVLTCVPENRLVLQARAWPGGEAEVAVSLEPDQDGTIVTITEDIVDGPTRLVPSALRAPALDRRNRESLLRLAYIAERRR